MDKASTSNGLVPAVRMAPEFTQPLPPSHLRLCRHHHRRKQAEGWWLEQPEPGVLVWHTPAGRTYTTTPTLTQYAI